MENRTYYLRQRVSRAAIDRLSRPGVYLIAQGMARGALVFALTFAKILQNLSPFGVAAAAASGGARAAYAFGGAALGYLLFGGESSLKYIAILVSVALLRFLLRQSRLTEKRLFAPLLAAGSTFFFGLFFLTREGITAVGLSHFLCECILIFGLTILYGYYFRNGLKNERNQVAGTISALLIISTVFVVLVALTFLGGVSAGRIAATVFCLVVAVDKGLEIACVAALIVGAAVGLASGNMIYVAIYGLCGLFGGSFSKSGRRITVFVYVIVSAFCAFLLWQELGSANLLYETLVAAAVFALLPQKLAARMAAFAEPKGEGVRIEKIKEYAASRFYFLAESFRELAGNLDSIMRPVSEQQISKRDLSLLIVSEVCRPCEYADCCIDRCCKEVTAEITAAAGQIVQQGYCQKNLLPKAFFIYCKHPEIFCDNVNALLHTMRQRRRQSAKAREERDLLRQQYKDIAQMLEKGAFTITQDLTFDTEKQRTILHYMRLWGIEAEVIVAKMPGGKYKVELYASRIGERFRDMPALTDKLARLLQVPLTFAGGKSDDCVILKEPEPYTLLIGVASEKKNGERVSGDSGGWIECDDGRVCIILSDGMGSGGDAGAESRRVVKTLEALLKSGFSAAFAVKLLEHTIRLSGQALYVTADILTCDLNTGDISIVKCGSAPTYIRRMGRVYKVTGQSYPIGSFLESYDKTSTKIRDGDTVVLITDGVEEALGERHITEYVAAYEGDGTRELAVGLLREAGARGGREDDMTVLSVRLKRREKSALRAG